MMITCPKTVKVLLVSTTMSPVTQIALVDVNSAFINVIPSVVDIGNNSNKVPTTTRHRKLKTNNLAGLAFIYLKNMFIQ